MSVFPFKNLCSSDWRTLQPFPALIALILPSRMYFEKVGLEILKYSIAWSVVKTESVSINGIALSRFNPFFFHLGAITMPSRILDILFSQLFDLQ